MKREYEKIYGERGMLYSEVIEESVYEMAVLSKMIIYLTGIVGENREREAEVWTSEES